MYINFSITLRTRGVRWHFLCATVAVFYAIGFQCAIMLRGYITASWFDIQLILSYSLYIWPGVRNIFF